MEGQHWSLCCAGQWEGVLDSGCRVKDGTQTWVGRRGWIVNGNPGAPAKFSALEFFLCGAG